MRLILASTSQIRRQLLRNAGLSFDVVPSNLDETPLKALGSHGDQSAIAISLATAKAEAVSQANRDATVLGADQVLAFGGSYFDKPATVDEARHQLLQLRGCEHFLISAAVCARNGKCRWSAVRTARLVMRDFSDAFLDNYLTALGDDVLTSVGGYKLEGRGIQLFQEIEGDFFTILGLPLLDVLAFLRSEGLIET